MYELIKKLINRSEVEKNKKEEFDFINDSNKELFEKALELYKRN